MYSQIDRNKRNSALLIAVFIGVLAVAGYAYGYVTRSGSVGLILALLVSTGWTLISWFAGSSLTLAAAGAQEVPDRAAFPTLWNAVENLAITAGLPMPRVFVVDDPSPNAFATGRDPAHASVAVTTGLLRRLDRTELEGVLAHELSHIGNYDTRFMVLTAALAGALVLLGDWMFRGMLFGRRNRDRDGNGLFMALGLIFILLSPLIGELIKLAVSRRREYLADASGTLLTRYPEGLASALEKIREAAMPMRQTSAATNHLWISDPTARSFGQRVSNLFSTHPPVEERIRLLREMVRA